MQDLRCGRRRPLRKTPILRNHTHRCLLSAGFVWLLLLSIDSDQGDDPLVTFSDGVLWRQDGTGVRELAALDLSTLETFLATLTRIHELHPTADRLPLRLTLGPDGPHVFENGVLYEVGPDGKRKKLVVVNVATAGTLAESLRRLIAALG